MAGRAKGRTDSRATGVFGLPRRQAFARGLFPFRLTIAPMDGRLRLFKVPAVNITRLLIFCHSRADQTARTGPARIFSRFLQDLPFSCSRISRLRPLKAGIRVS
jgi:hypothetical protein